MERSTSSNCLTAFKTHKQRMYVALCIATMLFSSSALPTQQASVIDVALAAAGDLDPTFGTGGKVTTNFFGFGARAFAVVIQPDGKIVTAGVAATSETASHFALARYNPNGTFDPTFGNEGRVSTDFGGFGDAALSMAIQADGKIVAAGVTSNLIPYGSDFALARYNPDGSLDASFGTGGKVITDFGGGFEQAFALAIQPNGKIVISGSEFYIGSDENFILARYNSDGSLDTGFGTAGRTVTDFSGSDDHGNGLVIQSDGKIVAVGAVTIVVDNRFFDVGGLARYNDDGTLDPTFGMDGKVTSNVGDFFRFAGVAQQSDGKVLAAGTGFDPGTSVEFALARYNPDGSLDASFGTGGRVTTAFFGFGDLALCIVLQPDGRIVAAGEVNAGLSGDFGIARYNRNGSLDETFGTQGKTVTDFFGADDGDRCTSIALQRDGKIVAAGHAWKELGGGSSIAELALARYNGVTFDNCLQDDRNGNLLQFNSTTGDYQFTNCGKGITLTGIGRITNDPSGCKTTLQDAGPIPKRPDRSVLVQVNRCTHAASASILIFSTGSSFSITDSDITNNTCACR